MVISIGGYPDHGSPKTCDHPQRSLNKSVCTLYRRERPGAEPLAHQESPKLHHPNPGLILPWLINLWPVEGPSPNQSTTCLFIGETAAH